MSIRIDHFMYGVPDLDQGVEWASDVFGIKPAYGGEHVGLGTRNALMSLGNTYLEIIAPDPGQKLPGTLGEQFANLPSGGMVTWALEGALSSLSATLLDLGVPTTGPIPTQRQTAEGDMLVWELLFPKDSEHGMRFPFFIDWLECANPKDTNPVGGQFQTIEVTTPEGAKLQALMRAIDLDITIKSGDPQIAVVVESEKGEVVLTSNKESSQLMIKI